MPKIALFMWLIVFLAAPSISYEKESIRILNWSNGYIDLDPDSDPDKPIVERSPTLRSFQEKFDCRIIYEEYDSQEEMLKVLFRLKNDYDIVITTTDMVAEFLDAGILSEISRSRVPNKKYVNPEFGLIASDPGGEYFAPYMAGSTGIAYRSDMFGARVASWADYFYPPDSLKARTGAMDTIYSLCHAMQFLGIDIHTRDENEMKRAANLYYRLKSRNQLKIVPGDTELIKNQLSRGELAMSLLYSGSTLNAMKNDPRIRYAIPDEGSELFIDCMVLMQDAPNKRLGEAFINHVLIPENHASIAVHLQYMVPNTAALEIIKQRYPDIYRNPMIYYSPEELKKLVIYQNVDKTALNRLWYKIKN